MRVCTMRARVCVCQQRPQKNTMKREIASNALLPPNNFTHVILSLLSYIPTTTNCRRFVPFTCRARQWHAVQEAVLLEQQRQQQIGGDDGDGGGESTADADSKDGSRETTETAAEQRRQKLLAVTYQLLSVNPDPMWLWTRRRRMLLSSSSSSFALDDDDDDSSPSSDLDAAAAKTELELTLAALKQNPKSYGAWLHRKWTLQRQTFGILLFLLQRRRRRTGTAATGPSNTTTSKADGVDEADDGGGGNDDDVGNRSIAIASLLEQELALVAQLLERDERNFHGWNYRRFVVSCQLQLAAVASVASPTSTEEEAAAATTTTPSSSSGVAAVAVVDGSWSSLLTAILPPSLLSAGDRHGESDRPLLGSSWTMGAQIVVAAKGTAARTTSVTTATTTAKHNASDGTATNTAATTTAIRRIVEQELEFSLAKIRSNFSNFSAFHYRSKLLPIQQRLSLLIDGVDEDAGNNEEDDAVVGGTGRCWWTETLSTELDLVESAIFTEPDE